MEKVDWKAEWQGLEPEQPKSGRCGCWLGLFLSGFVLLGTCAGTLFFAWQQLDLPLDPGSILSPASVPPQATLPPVDAQSLETPSPGPAPTQPPLAPTVTLASPAAEATLEEGPGGAIEAQRASSATRIDGDLSDWADSAAYGSTFIVFNDEGWDRTDDVIAYWRLGWDDENLYVAAQVEDDTHVQTQQGNTIFMGDGLSIQIDTQRDSDLGPSLSPDDYQINLSPGDFDRNPPAAYAFRGNESGTLVDMASQNIRLSALETEEGYTLEAAIPWSDLGVAPATGMRLGIALNVNDNDTPGTAVQEVMKSHIPTRRFSDPTSWGLIVLR